MNEIITVENTEMYIREYNGQRVVTFKDIDLVHQNKNGVARRNFNRNKKHFIEGEDYFTLTRAVSNETNCPIRNISVPNKGITVLTESGYLLIAKSFTDDLSWQVQRTLVNNYFKNKEQAISQQKVVEQKTKNKSLAEYTPEKIVDWKLNDLNKRLKRVEAELQEKSRVRLVKRLQPKVETWYEKNRDIIWNIKERTGIEPRKLYHEILEECGRYYNLDEAKEIYQSETGRTLAYTIDLVEYFPQLQDIADQVLDGYRF